MIRSFLALGFNRDEAGRRVFDGAYPHIGGGLMPLNVRFGQPVRAWGEQIDHLYPAYDFPFTYARQTDPLTRRTRACSTAAPRPTPARGCSTSRPRSRCGRGGSRSG